MLLGDGHFGPAVPARLSQIARLPAAAEAAGRLEGRRRPSPDTNGSADCRTKATRGSGDAGDANPEVGGLTADVVSSMLTGSCRCSMRRPTLPALVAVAQEIGRTGDAGLEAGRSGSARARGADDETAARCGRVGGQVAEWMK